MSDSNFQLAKDGPMKRYFPTGELEGFQVLHDPKETLFDIIFVHGLNGNSFRTWFDENTASYWPADYLPQDFPNARICTYGYDANVFKFFEPASQTNVMTEAKRLLSDVMVKRKTDEVVSFRNSLLHVYVAYFVSRTIGGLYG